MHPGRRPLLAAAFLLWLGTEGPGTTAEMPTQSERVVSYNIRARLVPAEQAVRGDMDLQWRNTATGPVQEVYLHLYLNAFRDRDSTFLRELGEEADQGASPWDPDNPGSITLKSVKNAAGDELWKEEYVAPDDGNEKDRTLARVALPAPVGAGESLALRIEFESRLPRVFRRAGWSGDKSRPETLFFMAAQWFPKVAVLRPAADGAAQWVLHQYHASTEFFSDYGTYEVQIVAPKGFIVGATGERVSTGQTPEGENLFVHRAQDVHDFAWCASPQFLEKTWLWEFDRFCEEAPAPMGQRIRETLAQAAESRGIGIDVVKPSIPVQVRFLLQRDQGRIAERFQWSVGAALACYGIWYGAYPYPVLTVVVPPDGGRSAGGMEYPTLITAFGNLRDPEYAVGMETVTIHEFGHQFFYGLLGSNEFEEAWLDEGMNSYSDARTYESAYGPEVATTRYGTAVTPFFRPFAPQGLAAKLIGMLRAEEWLKKVPRPWKRPAKLLPAPAEEGFSAYLRDMPFAHFDARMPVRPPLADRARFLGARTQDSMVLPGYEYATRGDYAVNSYPKASIFLYALRGLMGASAFDAAFAAYGERFRFRHPTTDDFLKTFLEKTPPAMAAPVEGFAKAMLFSSSTLDVAILDVSDRETGKEGKRQWTVRVQRRGAVPLPVEIWAEDEAGEKVLLDTWRGPPQETTKSFRTAAARRLKAVRLGPDWLAYVDKDLTNNARSAEGFADGRAAAAITVRWTAYVEEIVRSSAGLAR